MIDKIDAKLPGFTIEALLERMRSAGPETGSFEMSFDQHYGLRIIVREQWTEIQFREGGSWTLPEDTREFIRRLRDQK